MKYSDIEVGHIYFADLTPVQQYEFGGNHLCVVLRKCADKRSVTIVSMTSKSSGLGQNKIDIGSIPELPKRLREDKKGRAVNSYVVLDQVRTVVAGRIQQVKDGTKADGSPNIIDCQLSPFTFSDLVHKLTNISISDLNDEDAVGDYHKTAFLNYCIKKMIDLTYDIDKGRGDTDAKKKEVNYFYKNALAIKGNFLIDDYLTPSDITNKINEKLSSIVLIPSN
ncbi:type II toxin-antitoxin system PemK/MazF family toxin [Priestia sp. TSO9]|uniref:type II toxin-antitoxin system PemK/MazF family toxin n=1 Tax=Priestia sp. TSO9 TaxID=2885632 RepID=UPI001E620511|nr:type II toxin-antitoxin system PemK/MazF family toxin [Priestia sp. TSO9]